MIKIRGCLPVPAIILAKNVPWPLLSFAFSVVTLILSITLSTKSGCDVSIPVSISPTVTLFPLNPKKDPLILSTGKFD